MRRQQSFEKKMKWILKVVFFHVLCLCVVFGIGIWALQTMTRATEDMQIVDLKHATEKLQTGDLVLFKHKKYEVPWMIGVNRLMSHMGVVWRHPDFGPLLVDMNPTPHGAFKEPLPFEPVLQGPSVSVIRFADAVLFYPGAVFVRGLKKSLSPEAEFGFVSKLLDWGMHLEYDESIGKRDWITWLALALSPLLHEVSDWLFELTPLTHPRTSSFCTEMIAELFRASGILSKRHVSHVWGPIAWMHGVGAGAGDRDALWEREVQVIAH